MRGAKRALRRLRSLPAIAGRGVRFAPGVAGIALMSVGAGMVYRPAGLIVAGILLLTVDRRIP